MRPIIKARGLGKEYRLGAGRLPHATFRETVVSIARNTLTFRRSPRTVENMIWAIKDVDFDVFPGEVIGIIGRNGAGKSTLLKILSRITKPTTGRAELYGRFGSLLEVGTGFHPELTGRENIFLNGSILGMKRAEIRQRFDDIVDFAEVSRFLDTPVKHYSSGMYVRLAFAVAAHLEPEILIVDEVLAVGDHAFQQKCIRKMEDVSSAGRTVLFVSHNMGSVSRLCGRCLLLDEGRIRESGPAATIVQTYLTSGLSDLPEIRFGEQPERPLSLRRIAIQAKGELRGEIGYHEDLTLQFDYEVQQPMRGASVGFGLFALDGTCVFCSADFDGTPELLQRPRARGRHSASVVIPGHWLNPGRYVVRAYAASLGAGEIYGELESLAFTIIDTGTPASQQGRQRAGVLQPLLRWTTTPGGE
jgi:lipopolysaccharide transport system ATP-binding protein